MMKDIQAVVFDLYGTLIYLADETKPHLKLFLELGIASKEMRQARRIAITEDFENISGLITRIKPDAKLDIRQYEAEIAKEAASATAYPETKRVLERIRDKDLKIGLISNLASPYKKPFFDLGLDKYFDHVLFSCEEGLRKPDPKIYQRMMDDMGIDSSLALMTGDKVHADVDGPKTVGMNAILLDRDNKDNSSPRILTLEGIFQHL